MLKDGAMPTVFCWSDKGKEWIKVIRHMERETQADESDCEGEPDNVADDPSQPSAINQIELLQQQLSDIQAELHNANEQLKKSKQKAAEEANAAIKIISDVKAQAQSDID